jgi:hypothetical protein
VILITHHSHIDTAARADLLRIPKDTAVSELLGFATSKTTSTAR